MAMTNDNNIEGETERKIWRVVTAAVHCSWMLLLPLFFWYPLKRSLGAWCCTICFFVAIGVIITTFVIRLATFLSSFDVDINRPTSYGIVGSTILLSIEFPWRWCQCLYCQGTLSHCHCKFSSRFMVRFRCSWQSNHRWFKIQKRCDHIPWPPNNCAVIQCFEIVLASMSAAWTEERKEDRVIRC